MCSSPGNKQCPTCKSSRYCSIECQKRDWPVHKLLCKKMEAFDTTTRPSPRHVRAIAFDIDASGPAFIWHPLVSLEDTRVVFFRDGYRLEGWGVIRSNPTLKREVGLVHAMSVELNPASTVENKSCFKISSAMSKCIRGPMLFHGEDDLNTSDLRHIVDHLLFGFAARSEEDVKNGALRLNCMGDYITVERHIIEWCEGPLGATLEHDADFELLIPDHIGLALAAHRINPDTRWRNVPDVHRVQYFAFNSALTMLDPSEGVEARGSYFITRKDGKSLLRPHLHALMKYCISLQPRHWNSDDFDPKKSVEESRAARINIKDEDTKTKLKKASKEGFAKFYKEWVSRDHQELEHRPGPYDI